jgi:hypothetical protein
MGLERKIGWAAFGLAVLVAAKGATGAPSEPLIVTQLAEPDPNYVPQSEPRLTTTRASGDLDQDRTLDRAMQDFGRAIGQAAQLERQLNESRCRSGGAVPPDGPGRLAWEANCRYERR